MGMNEKNLRCISVRVKKLKTKQDITKLLKHDFRDSSIYSLQKHIDKERSNQNSVITSNVKSTENIVDNLIQNKGKVRKNAVLSYAGILTFSYGAQDTLGGLSKEDQDKYISEALKQIQSAYDVQIYYAVVHRDEQAVHCHFMMSPFQTKSKKSLNDKGLLGSHEGVSKLQDVAARAFASLNIGRGISKKERIETGDMNVKNMHPKMLRDRLLRQSQELEKQVEEKRTELQTLSEQISRIKEILKKYQRTDVKSIKFQGITVSKQDSVQLQETMKKVSEEILKIEKMYKQKTAEYHDLAKKLEQEKETLGKENMKLQFENQRLQESLNLIQERQIALVKENQKIKEMLAKYQKSEQAKALKEAKKRELALQNLAKRQQQQFDQHIGLDL